jgi:hypothetical protein
MKKVFTIILILIASLDLKAQKKNIQVEYFTQPDLKKFVGKWVYTDDTISFTIT